MELLASKVFALLSYIEEVEKLKRKPTYVVPRDPFAADVASLQGLPELQDNLSDADGSEVWLRVPRLQEIAPPPAPEDLLGWVTVSKTPTKAPTLAGAKPVLESRTQVGELRQEDFPQVKVLFDRYVEHLWRPWAEVEKQRRETIALYNSLFLLYQTLSGGEENPLELVWGIGMVSWKPKGAQRIEHPLITQLCELRLDPNTFALSVVPREADAKLELDAFAEMELPGVLTLESQWREMQATMAASVSPFEPSTYEGVLNSAVARLDPRGRYERCEGNYAAPVPDEQLLISDRWVVFARKRSADIFLEDVRRLKAKIEDGVLIPDVLGAFVTPGSSQVQVGQQVSFRGLSTSESGHGVRELYFPLPYNEEQISIVRKLETSNGVVVQGPPGTGKTHTIANVICHYLAQGKRVLVTSKGDTALSVLQEKLPERIRELSVALLADEKDGMKQFEASIGKIAAQVSALDINRLDSNISEMEAQLGELHAHIAAVDQAMGAHAAQHLRKYTFQGQEITPEELAKLVMAQADDHQWMVDALPADANEPPLNEAEVGALRVARQAAAQDLQQIGAKLAEPGKLPAWEALLALHKDIVRARSIDARVDSGAVHPLKDSSLPTFEAAKTLLVTLQEYLDVHERVQMTPLGLTLRAKLRDMQPDDVLLKALLDARGEVAQLEQTRRHLRSKAVDVPSQAEGNPDFTTALERLRQGKSPFPLPFGKSEARALIAATSVEGATAAGKEHWDLVHSAVAWRLDARRVLARYSSVGVEFGLDTAPTGDLDVGIKNAQKNLDLVETVHDMVFRAERQVLFKAVEGVFGTASAAQLGDDYEERLPELVESLTAHLEKGRLSHALSQLAVYKAVLDGKDSDNAKQIVAFLNERIGSGAEEEARLRAGWDALVADASRLDALRPQFDIICACAEKLTQAGAPKWARRVLTEPPTQDLDLAVPATLREAWNWRVAYGLLERIDDHAILRTRFEKRRELTTKLARVYRDLVAERAWRGVVLNSPPDIRQALEGYLTSVQRMGAGTGIRAIRHRGNARKAMARAYRAVPCWVLPQWRVSETLPAELGLFDLVVVDEASQSDIWALPALMRGSKLLVVGDHKQVSPSVVGMAEQKIVDIQNRFLADQAHGAYMTPDSSIYDLARVIFAGNSVMLKEHFRCAPAIIEYSNREFYLGEIRPLRVPRASERLDPPLIDVLVQGGYRKGDQNPPEAEAIVQQIEALVADETIGARTIGVVTLLGTEQSKLIHDLVNQRIPGEEIIARKIAVGPPPVFQGRERDIMLVSMVLAPGNGTAANNAGQQQRFNVALSRARDRVYLFRSVEHNAFPADSLSGRLLRHFRQPFTQDARAVAASRDLCESGFEQEVFDILTRRGFRVEPQVPCGGYRIDMVVEGADGRRLAIECDGDRYHGPGQWADDMARQRVLERAGWVFWRCFASSFVRRRAEVLNDLWGTLDKLGIQPLGESEVGAVSSGWVGKVEVDPMGVDGAEAEGAEPAGAEVAGGPA